MTEAINEGRLVYLYEALRCGSVRAAADAMDIAPSAVSRQIALLEDEVGTPLIERHKRGIRATPAGTLVADYLRQQRSHQADLLAKLQELQGLRRGEIALAMGEGFVSMMVGGPIADFRRQYPDISIAVDVLSTNDAIRQVVEDHADVALVFNPPAEAGIVSRAQVHAPLCAVVAPDFPLLGRPAPVRLADLQPYALGLMHKSFGTRQLVEAAALLEKLRLVPVFTTNSVAALKRFVQASGGYTLLAPLSIAAELDAGELRKLPLANPLLENSEAHLVTRVGRQLSPAAGRLLQQLASRMRSW